MDTYGVWSDLDGGFVATGPTKVEAELERERLIDEADEDDVVNDPDNLKVIVQCPDHEDEPAYGCSYCDADEDPYNVAERRELDSLYDQED